MVLITKTGELQASRNFDGFTLIELLIALLLVALLASLVTPIVTSSIHHARESTLKEDLHVLRKAIDDFYSDTGRYPESLELLVEKRYIRKIPIDPTTDRADSWIIVRGDGKNSGIMDIHSGSDQESTDGSRYQSW
jgi:general secretion pathway protein G